MESRRPRGLRSHTIQVRYYFVPQIALAFFLIPLSSLAGSSLLRPAEINESCALAAVGIYTRTAVETLTPDETQFKLAAFKNSITESAVHWEGDGNQETAGLAKNLLEAPENFSIAFVDHGELLNFLSVARKTLNIAQVTQYTANEKQRLFKMIQRSRDVDIGLAVYTVSAGFIFLGAFLHQLEALRSMGDGLIGIGIGAGLIESLALWLSSKQPPRDSSPLGDDPVLTDTAMDLWLRAQFEVTQTGDAPRSQPNFVHEAGVLIFRTEDGSQYLFASALE